MLQLLLLVLGVSVFVSGVAVLSIPAALIVGGALVAVFALMWDFGGDGA